VPTPLRGGGKPVLAALSAHVVLIMPAPRKCVLCE
jgi:hypothetical protein